MNVTQGLRRVLQTNPEGIATIDGDRRRSWREIGERVARLAGGLQGLGVKRGDRVAVLMLNSDRYLELYLGIAWAGAVIVPTNIRWSHAEIEDSLCDCRASALVVDKAFAAMGVELAKAVSLELIYADDDAGPAEARDYEKLIAASQPVPDATSAREELAGIFYTGGTTGRSKGVMLSHANIVSNALHMLSEGLLPDGTIYLNAAPMFHLANGGAMFASLIGGGTNVIVKTFNPELVMTAIETEKVTATLIVPTMIQMLVDHPLFQTADLSSLMRIMYGASPISEALLNRAMWGLPGTAFHQLYGMTELSPLATHLPWDQHTGENAAKKNRQRACGRAAIGCEVRIVDADRKPTAGRNRQRRHRRLDAHRRRRLHGRRRLCLSGRSREGHDHYRRRERLFHGSGERHRAASGGVAMRRDRHSQRAMGRDRPCLRDSERGLERPCR